MYKDVIELDSKALLQYIKHLQRCLENIQDHINRYSRDTGKKNEWFESEMGKHQTWFAIAVKRANDLGLSLEIK